MNSKSLFLLCAVLLANNLIAQNPDSVYRRYYYEDPTYTKCAFSQNGFRLKSKETIYNNVYLLYNNVQVGLADFLSMGATFLIIPISGENGSGALPFLMLNAKAGYDFGRYHHLSMSTNIAPITPLLIDPTLAYTFGTPHYYVGLAGIIENVFNERNLLLLQSGITFSAYLAIASEFILASKQASLVKSSAIYRSDKIDYGVSLFSIVGKLTLGDNKCTVNVGYFIARYEQGEGVFTLGFSIRLNRREPKK